MFVLVKLNFNPLNPELNPTCYFLALLGAHHFLHVSRIRVKSLRELHHNGYIERAFGNALRRINNIRINHQPDATIFQFIILTFI